MTSDLQHHQSPKEPAGYSLRILDEFPQILAEPKLDHIHGVFKKDRNPVSVEIAWLRLSPERRRLRFSFQFNDVKDPHRLSPSPLFSAGGRRRRLSSDRPLSCQPAFWRLCDSSENPRIWPQKSLRAAEGLPSKSVAIRLELGKILISERISSVLFDTCRSLRCEPRPEREAAI